MKAIMKRRSLTVILAAWWDEYAIAGGFILAKGSTSPSLAQSHQNFIETMRDTVHTLMRAGHRVIVVAQAPVPGRNPVDCIERTQLTGRAASDCAMASADRAEADQRVKRLLRLALEGEHAQVVSLFEQLCDARECRILTEQGKFVYMDQSHLSAAGAQLVSVSLQDGLLRR